MSETPDAQSAQAAEALRAAQAALHAAQEQAMAALSGDGPRAPQDQMQQIKRNHDRSLDGPRPLPLTEAVQKAVQRTFAEELREEVSQLLERDCGRGVPFHRYASSQELDRIRLAVIKLSKGELLKLRHWIAESNIDWRAVLQAESRSAHF